MEVTLPTMTKNYGVGRRNNSFPCLDEPAVEPGPGHPPPLPQKDPGGPSRRAGAAQHNYQGYWMKHFIIFRLCKSTIPI